MPLTFPVGFWRQNQDIADPFAANVVLFLKGDGTNGSTSIVDSSPSPKTITVVGNAQISTAQSKYGDSSILFGSGNYLRTAYNALLTPALRDFTIEGWIRVIAPTNEYFQLFSSGARNTSSNFGGYTIFGVSNGIYIQNIRNNGTLSQAGGLFNWVANTWYHVAVCRNNTGIKFFVNGNLLANDASWASENIVNPNNLPSLIGSSSSGGTENFYPYDGYTDSFRYTDSVCRYTANFNPETDTYLNI